MAVPVSTDVDPLEEETEGYDENADEDFNPDKAVADDAASSSSDDDNEIAFKTPKASKKRKSDALDELDSGDEATIKERKRKKRKGADANVDEEESAGEGGLIKTRAQRLAEYVIRGLKIYT